MIYLQEDKGYSSSDIRLIERDFDRLPRYSIWITFEDESFVRYQYIEKRNNIEQQTYEINEESVDGSGKLMKETDINPNNLLHFDSPKAVERRY
ncbi:hypothetical protein ACFSTA_02120 [Ornithinibacillus salinisoli]|uniref:Outer membrane lipoprotein-sorting protein n=2 Tax=Ornithinibacillus salinisoli TaxID=1848459 RepID=A0ABW4VTZ9_9BACI